jgi:ribosome biogenesis protein BMS1
VLKINPPGGIIRVNTVYRFQGAKLFYFSRLSHHEGYPRNEVTNLARFISVAKTRPIQWRSSHPYLLVDRVEDLTDPNTTRLGKSS